MDTTQLQRETFAVLTAQGQLLLYEIGRVAITSTCIAGNEMTAFGI